ncbi:MAG: NfeD family protein [Defluviitaleaceae bacterium]|nr:NfeD family protein [Defluviitaleaceae bacterium]
MNPYFILFGVGLGFVVISFVFGNLSNIEGVSFSFLRPTLIAVFLTVTGGLGLLLTPRMGIFYSASLVMFASVAGGLIVAALINRFVVIPLHRAQNTSAFDKQATIGVSAEVVSPIPQGGFGKIRYTISGSTVTSPAKSEDGNQIKLGEYVEIIYIEKNTYFVRKAADGV